MYNEMLPFLNLLLTQFQESSIWQQLRGEKTRKIEAKKEVNTDFVNPSCLARYPSDPIQ